MRIANPLYDVVFKYLLDDEKVARLVLSALVGEEVLELQARPAEVRPVASTLGAAQLLVLCMDFAATLRHKDGSRKRVLIELRKARNTLDLQRYRRCPGTRSTNPGKAWLDAEGRPEVLPILTLYVLGEGPESVDMPVLRINRHAEDGVTGEAVRISGPFVEALSHDCIVVQINRINNRRRTDLERLLEVFDQGRAAPSGPRVLDIREETFPEKYRAVLHRLLRAGAEQEILDKMDLEEDVLAAFKAQARESSDLRQTVEAQAQALAGKDKAIEERSKAIEAKDSLIADLQRRLST